MKKILLGVALCVLSMNTSFAYTQFDLVAKQDQYIGKLESRIGDRLDNQPIEKLEEILTKIDTLYLKYEFSTDLSDAQKLDKLAILLAVKQIIEGVIWHKDAIVEGDTVSVHYDLKLEDGTLKDSSRTRGEPFEFVIGKGQVISGWDTGLMGKNKGDNVSLVIPPEEAYGIYDSEKTQVVPKSEMQQFVDSGITLRVGAILPTQFGNFEIVGVDDDTVTVDINHELAGETLYFEIEVIDIKKNK